MAGVTNLADISILVPVEGVPVYRVVCHQPNVVHGEELGAQTEHHPPPLLDLVQGGLLKPASVESQLPDLSHCEACHL